MLRVRGLSRVSKRSSSIGPRDFWHISDFLEVEGILSKLQIVEALQLTAKQMQLYKEIVARVNELVRDLTNDVAQEHGAA
jgi:hypothetical protein